MSALNFSSFISGIAEVAPLDANVRGKCHHALLPRTVIPRSTAMPEPTKDEVLRVKEYLDSVGIINHNPASDKTFTARRPTGCVASPQSAAGRGLAPYNIKQLSEKGIVGC